MKILIVDDSAAMRMMVVRALRQADVGKHDIEQAGDGVEALEAIGKAPPDLILADWNMPNMTGMELLTKLREDGNEVTFGFVTTEATEPMRRKASEAGAKFLIAKPITSDAFERVFNSLDL